MIDKEKAINILKKLIHHNDSVLSVKYHHSHEKLGVLYRKHVIEILTGEKKGLKYCDVVIQLDKKEYKEVHDIFMTELNNRRDAATLKRFNDLENEIS